MSLEIGDEQKGKVIAYLYNGTKCIDPISYVDDEDNEMDEGERLRRIRLKNKDEHFVPAVTDYSQGKQVDRIYVTGETGCGKSTSIGLYANEFHKMYPKAKVMLFSSKKEDEALDKYKFIKRVKIDEHVLAHPITLKEISSQSPQTLVIFDDIQDFPNVKLNKEILRLLHEIMRNGRSYGIYSVFVHHDPCDYRETKGMLFECNKVFIFPRRCGKGAYTYLMDKKLHMSKENMKMINTLKSSFVCINKGVPKYIVSDKYIILDQ